MLNLDATDKLSGIASSADKIEYTFSGVDGSDIVSGEGKLGTNETLIHECTGALRLYSVTYVNTHDSPVQCHLHKDPGGIGTVYHLLPDSFILGPGNLMLFDGSRCQIINPAGELLCGFPSPLSVPNGGTGLSTFAQGDILYAPAANVVGGLTKGPANKKLFMNAGAAAPEWAAGIKIGAFTRDISIAAGTQVVAGVGFKPSAVDFIAGVPNTPAQSVGMDNGTIHVCYWNRYGINPGDIGMTGTWSIYLCLSVGEIYSGTISVLGADGFTVLWARTGTPTGTANIYFKAHR